MMLLLAPIIKPANVRSRPDQSSYPVTKSHKEPNTTMGEESGTAQIEEAYI